MRLKQQYSSSVKKKFIRCKERFFRKIRLCREKYRTSKSEVFLSSSIKNELESVPLFKGDCLIKKPVRMICFYLPQFHPVPENDEWWGQGFTEWTNVKPALPQFERHYQPHIPGELGYYNLLDAHVQKKQVELAKLYGLEAFCFYFYWFSGTRLLEDPIKSYLENDELDLPFLLCWANENWSRRWDGLDKEILISQNYSDEDDLDFIRYVSQYLKSHKYFKINGKPVILVYRPSLFPSIEKTVERWRSWCRENGIGEIYLIYTQSFENVDPKIYGFDAAAEFPPNNSAPPELTKEIEGLNGDFGGHVFDWSVFVERSLNYKDPAYKLFRGVCPGWDNTPRRKNKSTIFVNSSPELFYEWVSNAIRYTHENYAPEERLIFVNAWNEWGEGAHLEPDQKYGYAYLNSIRNALVDFNENQNNGNDEIDLKSSFSRLALVIHVFYLNIFDEILEAIDPILLENSKFFVTCPKEHYEYIEDALARKVANYKILLVENRGRDVLPFLKLLPDLMNCDFDFLVKIHTKKSKHRDDGDRWRKEMISQLIGIKSLMKGLNLLMNNSKIGILGPSGHVVPMSYYYGSNQKKIEIIAEKLRISRERLSEMTFVAGTMFLMRKNILKSLSYLNYADADFEIESGQTDGTMAHAMERAFSLCALKEGFSVSSLDEEVVSSYPYVN